MATFETFFPSPSYILSSLSIATYVNSYVLVGSIAILSPTVVRTIPIYHALPHVDLATSPNNLSSQTYYINPLCLIQNRGLSEDLSNHDFSLSHTKENVSGGWFMDSPQAPGPSWHAGYLRKVDDSKAVLVSETEGSLLSKHVSSALISQNNPAMQMEETMNMGSVYSLKNGINYCEGPTGNSFRRNQSYLCEVDPKHELSGTKLEVDPNIDSLAKTSMLKSSNKSASKSALRRHSHNTYSPRKNSVFSLKLKNYQPSILGPHPSSLNCKAHSTKTKQSSSFYCRTTSKKSPKITTSQLKMSLLTEDDEAFIKQFVGLSTVDLESAVVAVPTKVTSSTNWDLCLLARIVTNMMVLDGPFAKAKLTAWGSDPATIVDR